MIELNDNKLVFSFPDVHPGAQLTIELQRTLRIPDNDKSYPLPPGFGRFPLEHVDDYQRTVPEAWIEHGGVMMPMYQSEAMWINFQCGFVFENDVEYPFAVKIGTGKINAVDGNKWDKGLKKNRQNYVAVPRQPWLDGFCVDKGIIRQFVATPLGEGHSAEEQITGKAEYGGLQIHVYPMKLEAFNRRCEDNSLPKRNYNSFYMEELDEDLSIDMGIAPGGRMRQEIFEDGYAISEYDMDNSSRCFVHIANSAMWRSITGDYPPTPPVSAEDYNAAGLPWFEYYSDSAAIAGSGKLSKMKSLGSMTGQPDDASGADLFNSGRQSDNSGRIIRVGKF